VLKRINWFTVAVGVVALAVAAGAVWAAWRAVVWLWTEHRGPVIAVVVLAVFAAAAVQMIRESEEEKRRQALARRAAELEAEERAQQEREAAAEANRARVKPPAPAGWYPDPNDDDRELWWTGTSWEARARPAPGAGE
jgi:membrane protein implicated in regulation of membrane protease activity